jgi:hypothetical protein
MKKQGGLADHPLFRTPVSTPPQPQADANARTGEQMNTRIPERVNTRTDEQVDGRTFQRSIKRYSFNLAHGQR